MVDPHPDLTPRAADFKPYPLSTTTRHAPPGTRMLGGKYPVVTGLEHDEFGHPTGRPKLHIAMTAKRRDKLRALATELPLPEVNGDPSGEVLLVGWGSTYGPIHEAVNTAVARGESMGAIHLRHVHPLPDGLEKIFANFKRIVVVEMNDEGVYGFGQLAMILRARYCDPRIESLTKTDGLTYRVREILEGALK
jgi:2-oxoglutarate ferredoxin oxidoreductase subunit alpha